MLTDSPPLHGGTTQVLEIEGVPVVVAQNVFVWAAAYGIEGEPASTMEDRGLPHGPRP
jgi:hypothetical protein